MMDYVKIADVKYKLLRARTWPTVAKFQISNLTVSRHPEPDKWMSIGITIEDRYVPIWDIYAPTKFARTVIARRLRYACLQIGGPYKDRIDAMKSGSVMPESELGISIGYTALCHWNQLKTARLEVEHEIRHGKSVRCNEPYHEFRWYVSCSKNTPSKDDQCPANVVMLPMPSWRVIACWGQYREISSLYNENGLVQGNWSY